MPAATFLHSLKNSAMAKQVITGGTKFFTNKSGQRLARYSAIGAGMGALHGLADNFIGQDRVSVLGGAITGGMYGGAFWAGMKGWKYGRGALKARIAARAGNTGLTPRVGIRAGSPIGNILNRARRGRPGI